MNELRRRESHRKKLKNKYFYRIGIRHDEEGGKWVNGRRKGTKCKAVEINRKKENDAGRQLYKQRSR